MNMVHPTSYSLAGLCLTSDWPLAGLPVYQNGFESKRILIRRGKVPEALDAPEARFSDGECNKRELLLKIPKVARYLIRDGNEIIVDEHWPSNASDVSAYLMGTALGVLGHQRGLPPLHASAVDVQKGCVAFLGSSGAGKSTLAAALAGRGYQVISDDMFFLSVDDGSPVRAWPGANRLRLWDATMRALGHDEIGAEREFRGHNKFLIPLRPPPDPNAARLLQRLYLLEAGSEDERPAARRLYGSDAFEAVIQNIYRLNLAECMGRKPLVFDVCSRLARDVEVFRYRRPIKFASLPQTIDVFEEHLHGIFR